MSIHTKNFRWDVQGLRAIAILAVLIFHIDSSFLPGGYIGVDIFFVISGYLIMGIIWRDLETNDFHLSDFYIKRIYRLFPALFFMVIVSSIVAYFVLLPVEIESYVNSLISTLFYFSNFYFYSQSDYFNTAMEYAPLLHTWSLSVEEQFYMLFPFMLIWVYVKKKTRVISILLVISFISLLVSQLAIYQDSTFAFFSSPTRFFQFTFGGIIAIGVKKNMFSKTLNDLFGVVGLILITFSFYLYSSTTPFPGINALLPTLGTALILFSGMNVTYIGQLLSIRVLTLIGNASYSIYLWHWPLIVFYKLKVSPDLSILEQISIFMLSLLFGYLSWRYIENVTRRKRLAVKNVSFIALVLGVSFIFSVIVFIIFKVYPNDNLRYKSKAYQYLSYDATSNFRGGKCFLTSKFNDIKFFDKEECITYKKDKKNYLLLGDSHAAHFYSALDALKTTDETLSQVTSSGCPPVISSFGSKSCRELMQWGYEELIPNTHYDTIILSANWGYFKIEQVIKSIKWLLKYTDQVIVLGPSMQYRQSLPRLLVECGEDKDTALIYKTAGHLKKLSKIDEAMKESLNTDSRVKYISILNIQCDATGCKTITSNGAPVNFDEGHLTHDGALSILKEVQEDIFGRK